MGMAKKPPQAAGNRANKKNTSAKNTLLFNEIEEFFIKLRVKSGLELFFAQHTRPKGRIAT
jgi:hypothetical protein